MLRVGRSVVVGHSGGCRCPGDHASLQAAPRIGVSEWWHVLGQAVCLGSLNSEVLKKLGVL